MVVTPLAATITVEALAASSAALLAGGLLIAALDRPASRRVPFVRAAVAAGTFGLLVLSPAALAARLVMDLWRGEDAAVQSGATFMFGAAAFLAVAALLGGALAYITPLLLRRSHMHRDAAAADVATVRQLEAA